MAEIDEDPELVHLLDGRVPRLAEAGVRGLEAAVAQEVPAVVSRLDDAKAEAVQVVEPREVRLERDGILEAVDDAGSAGLSGRRNVRRAPNAREHVRVPVDLALVIADTGHGFGEGRVRRRRADG